jgi:anti-anti-sigma regulatory factor
MKKQLKTVIKVARVLAPVVGSRDVVDLLKPLILKADNKSVVLSFDDVEFISRSAAHELLLVQAEMHQEEKYLSFEDTNEEVAAMLRTVAANRALPKSDKPEFKPKKINIDSLLREVAA